MCAVSFKRHILMLFCQLVNVVAETVGIPVLSDDVGVSMCVLRSFAVFVITIVTIFVVFVITIVTIFVAAVAAAAAAVMTDMPFFDSLILFGQTENVAAETVDISVLQGRFVPVCSLLRSFAVFVSSNCCS